MDCDALNTSRTSLLMGIPFTGETPLHQYIVPLLQQMTKEEVLRFIPMDSIDWVALLWQEILPFELAERYKTFIPYPYIRAPYLVTDIRSFNTLVEDTYYYDQLRFQMFTYEMFRPLMDTKRVRHVDDEIIAKYHAELDGALVSTWSTNISLESLDRFDPATINWEKIYPRYGWHAKETFWFQEKYIYYDRRLCYYLN